ncbi:hypothetical protein TVAGG3_1044960 [Trichomonas vaginalis G3]|nr:hypothetical protein TVAGG3_1044960 [Trichomonas vaginalis G3]KAI5493795.1 hypothetical protein TVAGG3_1044960 [Trichomonas vaginalis G3]
MSLPFMSQEPGDFLTIQTNAITFSLIAKHLLPKHEIENIGVLMSNCLDGLIDPDEMIKEVSNIMKSYHNIDMVWKALIERDAVHMTPLYTDLTQFIRHLLECGVPEYYIISFLTTIITHVRRNVRNIKLISLILNYQFLKKYHGISVKYLLMSCFKIASRIERLKIKTNLPPIFNVYSLIYQPIPEQISPPSIRYKDVVNKPPAQANKPEENEISLGFSYRQTKFLISPLPSTLILNTYAKSSRVGSEGGTFAKVSDFERFFNYLITYAHTVFESFVTADISSYAMIRFNQGSKFLLKNAITDLYHGEASTVYRYIERTDDFKLLKKRVKQNLKNFVDYRFRIEEKVSLFTDVYPVFDVQTFIKFSNRSEPTKIIFDIQNSNACFIIAELCMNYMPRIGMFINNVLPIFTLNVNEKCSILCNDSIACALYYFNLACSEMVNLLKPAEEKEPSLRAIIDSAVFEVESKYCHAINSEVTDFLDTFFGKFTRNTLEFYSLLEESVSKFGKKTPSLFKLVLNLEKVLHAAEKCGLDRNYSKYIKLAKVFGKATGPRADEILNSRFPLLKKKLAPISLISGLVKLDIDGNTKEMTITPITL